MVKALQRILGHAVVVDVEDEARAQGRHRDGPFVDMQAFAQDLKDERAAQETVCAFGIHAGDEQAFRFGARLRKPRDHEIEIAGGELVAVHIVADRGCALEGLGDADDALNGAGRGDRAVKMERRDGLQLVFKERIDGRTRAVNGFGRDGIGADQPGGRQKGADFERRGERNLVVFADHELARSAAHIDAK